MVISIERERVYESKDFPGVKVTYKVPTAEDFEKIIREKPGDCDIFNTFAKKVEGVTDENEVPYKVENIVQLPGTWPIVTGVAKAVIESATLGLDGKNE